MKKIQLLIGVWFVLSFNEMRGFLDSFRNDLAMMNYMFKNEFEDLSFTNKVLFMASAPMSFTGDVSMAAVVVSIDQEEKEKEALLQELLLERKAARQETSREAAASGDTAPTPAVTSTTPTPDNVQTVPPAAVQVEVMNDTPHTAPSTMEPRSENTATVERGQQQPPVTDNSPTINIMFPAQQVSFLKQHRLTISIFAGATTFILMIHTFYVIKAIERLMTNKNSWMNWEVSGIRAPGVAATNSSINLLELTKGIYMKYSFEYLGDREKPLEVFCLAVEREIKSLKKYIKIATVIKNMHMRTLFGVALSSIDKAIDKIKKLEDMKELVLEDVLAKKLERNLGRIEE